MNNKDTGGAAFPHPVPVGAWGDASQGMTLRDYFAAKAMQTLIKDSSLLDQKAACYLAYILSDEMLKARK